MAVGIPRKQSTTPEDWLVAQEIMAAPDHERARRLIDEAVDRVTQVSRLSNRFAYAWSGGKDSQLLRLVCENAGLERAVCVLTELEYPAFERWVFENLPVGCEVLRRPYDLPWLAAHPDKLFPDPRAHGWWGEAVQRSGQREYAKRQRIDVMLFGRRVADGNVIGPSGYMATRSFIAFSPMWDWSHEDAFHVLGYANLALPPTYSWPNGYRVGTGPWPKRRRINGSELETWKAVAAIDPRVVMAAARYFPVARQAL